jgi:23S rRNA maturation mini-RNase III
MVESRDNSFRGLACFGGDQVYENFIRSVYTVDRVRLVQRDSLILESKQQYGMSVVDSDEVE